MIQVSFDFQILGIYQLTCDPRRMAKTCLHSIDFVSPLLGIHFSCLKIYI